MIKSNVAKHLLIILLFFSYVFASEPSSHPEEKVTMWIEPLSIDHTLYEFLKCAGVFKKYDAYILNIKNSTQENFSVKATHTNFPLQDSTSVIKKTCHVSFGKKFLLGLGTALYALATLGGMLIIIDAKGAQVKTGGWLIPAIGLSSFIYNHIQSHRLTKLKRTFLKEKLKNKILNPWEQLAVPAHSGISKVIFCKKNTILQNIKIPLINSANGQCTHYIF